MHGGVLLAAGANGCQAGTRLLAFYFLFLGDFWSDSSCLNREGAIGHTDKRDNLGRVDRSRSQWRKRDAARKELAGSSLEIALVEEHLAEERMADAVGKSFGGLMHGLGLLIKPL